MKTIYLNAEFQCSVKEKPDTVHTIETEVFEGKCNAYIEGMRLVPEGETWERPDGVVFQGEMISPYKDSLMLNMTQAIFEEMEASQEAQNADISYIGMMTDVIV